MNILVTGGAGYIGSHISHYLVDNGYKVIVVDNFSTGKQSLLPKEAIIYKEDLKNIGNLSNIFTKYKIQSVIHLAGSIIVSESVENPYKYYLNNTINTINLYKECMRMKVKNFIFSSTSSVYGDTDEKRISEKNSLNPKNPYAKSKLYAEKILFDISLQYNSSLGILRYFNVAGADQQLRTGQISKPATHLIKVACETALGIRPSMEIYGTDYDTPDGTCIRDYIHVSDLAELHILTLQHMIRHNKSITMNCGYGHGYSVKQVLEKLQKITNERLNIYFADRRPGDASNLVADVSKLNATLNWKPKYDSIEKIISSSLKWENKVKQS